MMHRQSLAEYQKVYLKINLTLETLPPPPKKKNQNQKSASIPITIYYTNCPLTSMYRRK